jgi:hypothetical protein
MWHTPPVGPRRGHRGGQRGKLSRIFIAKVDLGDWLLHHHYLPFHLLDVE